MSGGEAVLRIEGQHRMRDEPRQSQAASVGRASQSHPSFAG